MYELQLAKPLATSIRAAARDRIEAAIAALDDVLEGGDVHEGIHTARKRTKQVRALTRLVRTAAPELHATENAAARDAARLLAPARDAQVVLETLARLADDEDVDDLRAAAATLRPDLQRTRDKIVDASMDDVGAARAALAAQLARVAAWEVPDTDEAWLGGWTKTYRRARNRLADVLADPATGVLHQWRKRVKYHRYHVDFLAPLWPGTFTTREDELHALTDRLGRDHDLAVLWSRLREADGIDLAAARVVVAFVQRARADDQQRAIVLGRRLFATGDEAMRDLLAACRRTAENDTLPPAMAADTDG